MNPIKHPKEKQEEPQEKSSKRKLTDKQQKYVNCYCGDIKQAAKEAGISYVYARQLHTKSYIGNVIEAIRVRNDTLNNAKIMTRQQRQEFWTKMALEAKNDGDALRASELLARSEGDFLDRQEHTFKEYLLEEHKDVSDEELLSNLREFHIGSQN